MDQINKLQYISSLITKELLGIINQEETAELSDWLNSNIKHRLIYQKLKSKDYSGSLKNYKQIDIEKGLNKYNKRFTPKKHLSLYHWLSIVAIAIIFIGISVQHFTQNDELTAISLQPGISKAILTLADGTEHELNQTLQESSIRIEGVTVNNNGSELQYIPSDTLKTVLTKESYNTLRIPTGGEYMLIMSDGTKVWLNSQTVLRYPVSFHGEERHVELEGEAYFEVAKDEKRPFYVKTSHQVRVEVLGTSFNIRAYRDEQDIETVLEKGAVRMWQDTQSVTLSPGNRALFNTEHRHFIIEPVNTELYTAWHSGQYIFEEETIENILHKLSRWYDMNVFFADNAAKNLVFSGNIRKYDTILHLLNAIEATGGVRFEIKNNTVIVNSVSK